MSAQPYRVYWDSGDWESFDTFADALRFYGHLFGTKATAVYLMNHDRADDSDPGLTEDERDQLECAEAEVA